MFRISSLIPRRTSLLILLSAFQIFSVSAFVFAQPQQSENFRITKSVLDAGGAPSTSTNFHLVSAFGQPTPIGVASSANFTLYAGFLTPAFAVSPNAPFDLVIKRQPALSNDMKLDWSAVSGATSYVIYRDTNPIFTPAPGNQVGTSGTNSFIDAGAVGLPAIKYFYIVEAVGGASPAALLPGDLPKQGNGDAVAKVPSGSPKAASDRSERTNH
jgi:hypothetical protein